jgi:hypothetical protein
LKKGSYAHLSADQSAKPKACFYLAILTLSYFYVSNRYTLTAFLGIDLLDDKNLSAWALGRRRGGRDGMSPCW